MKLSEVIEHIENGFTLRLGQENFAEIDGICVFNSLVPLPIVLARSISTPDDIQVNDENGQEIGFISYCKNLNNVDVDNLTDAKYAAYISEVNPRNITGEHSFEHDYIVIKHSRYREYLLKYKNSAALWGGFFHEGETITPYEYQPLTIRAVPDISFPTIYHEKAAAQSVVQFYGFERFLRLYHLLELLFDYDLVQKIQNLGTDLYGVGKLLSDYDREELQRLKLLLKTRCTQDVDKIGKCLDKVKTKSTYLALSKEIFFKYGKAGNPFSEETAHKYDELMLKADSFTEVSLNSLKLANTNNKPYGNFILDTAAYWIYRIRCCIAHQRIGEYVMSNADEEFVVEVMEPLIREVLCQAFCT